jgi:excisionase family DNA binding protein
MEIIMTERIKPAALSIQDAAAYTGLSRSTLYRMIDRNELSSFKIGIRRLIKTDALDKLIENAVELSLLGD